MSVYACVLSYKMADRTDKTVEQLEAKGFTPGADLLVFENQNEAQIYEDSGNTRTNCSQWVNEFTGDNLRMTGGFNYICDKMAKLGPHTGIWFCTNDFDLIYAPDNLPEYFEYLLYERKDLGWIHPSKVSVPHYAYPWMDPLGTDGVRTCWMTDFICPLIRWDALLEVKKVHRDRFWFDPAFYRGWGIDYETCYLMRQAGYQIGVDDNIVISHEASETYRKGVAPESQQEFYDKALAEMRQTLANKYGPKWEWEFKK